MDFQKAKQLDRWIGLPVCLLLSAAEIFRKIFGLRAPVKNPPLKRILFIGLSEMGSNVLAHGATEKIKNDYPRAEIFFLVFDENKEAVALLGNIKSENILTIRHANLWTLFTGTLRFLKKTRRSSMDAVIDMELFSRYSSALAYMSGAKVRVGFHGYSIRGLNRGILLTHRVQFNPYKHISRNFMALARALTADPSDQPLVKEGWEEPVNGLPGPFLAADQGVSILRKLKHENPAITDQSRLVVINPDCATRLPLRRWPAEKYGLLAERLLQLPDLFVVAVGIGPNEAGPAVKHERYINLIGKTTLRELLDLFSIAKVLVSHDSGAVHLASVTGIAIVVMFGPETPFLYGPLNENKTVLSKDIFCSPCFSPFNNRTSVCGNNVCMKQISVDEVFRAVESRLDER